MEVVQGKSTDKKIVFAQEIAFAKVLAGNNKTLRDQALKKLRKWLIVRGNGKWVFTEEEFIRIWTGLFYCMWMSDKFLVQEELAENISQLIHCFKKNNEGALLFIKSFHIRILMEYEGLDQYRIDKFNMLIRRFLRQSFVYCHQTNWDEKFLTDLMNIFYEVVFQKNNPLGFVLHFIHIFPEELAKVSRGKLDNQKITILLEPFVKLLARAKEDRLQRAAEEFFLYLMRQTDAGIDFEEKFNAWRQMGFPGTGTHCIQREFPKGEIGALENGWSDESDQESDDPERPLDPRAGSVHVDLPQIPIDIDNLINLFKKHEHGKFTTTKGKRRIRSLTQKFSVIKKGKFPTRVRKDPIIDEKTKKPRLTVKTAKQLLQFTDDIDSGPVKTKELVNISKQLGGEDEAQESIQKKKRKKRRRKKSKREEDSDDENNEASDSRVSDEGFVKPANEESPPAKKKRKKVKKRKQNGKENSKEAVEPNDSSSPSPKKVRKGLSPIASTKKVVESAKKVQGEKSGKKQDSPKEKQLKEKNSKEASNGENLSPKSVTAAAKIGVKRKILSTWQVQDIDPNSLEFDTLKPQKITKVDKVTESVENQEPKKKISQADKLKGEKRQNLSLTPSFWQKATAKVGEKKRKSLDSKVFLNPLSNGIASSNGLRRISFALDKNMAQENEEYLEEVRNSPRVPFDGTKKPIQSALKSGLPPSPINPFYRYKKIKF